MPQRQARLQESVLEGVRAADQERDPIALPEGADLRRFVGRLAKVSSYERVEERRHWTGRILSCEDGVLTLSLETEGARARIPIAKIAHGQIGRASCRERVYALV